MTELQYLMQQIEEETEASYLALYGPAAVAAHAAINVRMSQGAGTLNALFEEGRVDEAFALWNAGILEAR